MESTDKAKWADQLSESDERVWAELQRFKAMLPRLLADYDGKWVVFKDGAVRFASDDEEEAYAAGVEMFGPQGEFVFRRVVEDTGPVWGTNGTHFGWFSS